MPSVTRPSSRPRLAMSAAVEKYLRELELLRKPATVYRVRLCLTEYLKFAKPHDVRQGIIDYLAACKARGCCNATWANRRTILLGFYKSIGVSVSIPRFTVRKEKPSAFSADECNRLLAAAAVVAGGRHRPMIQTLLSHRPASDRISEPAIFRRAREQNPS